MDNTELHYLTFDPEAIWDEMITNYVDAGGDLLYPGDEKEMLLRSVQADIVQAFAGVDNALRMQTLRYAVGEYLDVIGENRGCIRLEATYAHAIAKITMKTSDTKYILPAGTIMITKNNMYYTLDENLEVGSKDIAYVNITANESGRIGNALRAGETLTLQKPSENLISIVAFSEATGGTDREIDDDYRNRIREYGLASVTTGPASQYRAAAMSVDSRIIDAIAVNAGAGGVNVYLSTRFENDEPDQWTPDIEEITNEIIANVTNKLSAEDTRPLTDSVNVSFAIVIKRTIYAIYESDTYTVNKENLESVVEQYLNWQNYYIGRAFNPDKLKAMLYQAGADKITLKAKQPSPPGASTGDWPIETPEYTEIQSHQRNLVDVILLTQKEFDDLTF